LIFNFVGYLDLSVKKIRDKDITEGTEKYNKSKQVNSIIYTLSKMDKMPDLEKLYLLIVWPL